MDLAITGTYTSIFIKKIDTSLVNPDKSPSYFINMRTLLPLWKIVRVSLGVEQKEPPETFGWIKKESLRRDLELAKNALDMNDWSRDYLKNYNTPLEGFAFCDDMGVNLLSNFGSHHSGSTSCTLAWLYKEILNNWDNWVLKTKNAEAKLGYSKQQLNDADIDDFVDAFYHMERLRNGRKDSNPERTISDYEQALDEIRAKFKISMENEELEKKLMDIHYEILEERNKALKDENEIESNKLVTTLKFLYRIPIRWFTSPLGPGIVDIRKITAKEIAAMEAIYPDYREYFEKVKAVSNEKIAMTPLFEAPNITEEQILEMSKVYPDYRQHILKITELRMKDMIL